MAPRSRLHSVIIVTETERRFVMALRRLRWPAVIVWLLAIMLLHGLSGSLSKVTNHTASAYLPSSAPSTKVALLQQARGQGTQHGASQAETNAAIVVFVRDSGLTARDRAAAAAARTAVAGLSGHVAGLAGLALTGGVITTAGVVLAGTFAALTQIPRVGITEVGTAVALGVLLDTLLVRTVLVPASLLTIGERVWWPGRRHHHPGPARHRQGDLEPL
jgi:uncharacterized membrane protein YdfJ with MMPL/SSD domain